MGKIYLLLYSKETHKQFFKYFESSKEKEKFKRRIKYSDKVFIIEDSEDINYNYKEGELDEKQY